MANLPESSSFDAGVYQIETSDPVLGGPSGVTNTPLKNLANRTRYLKDHVDDLEDGSFVPPGIATQNWVNGELQKRDMKASVRCATTANISLSGLQTIDGVALSAGDRVLVRAQSAGQDNGIYVAASGAWARSADANASEKVTPGMMVYVESGSTLADIIYKLTTEAPVTLGSSVLTFANILVGYAPLASPTFSGNPAAPTPAQFDNDTSLATTEFVQRALGSKRAWLPVNTSASLGVSALGMLIGYTGGSTYTVTLPPTAGLVAGAAVSFYNNSAVDQIVAAAGSDTIAWGSASFGGGVGGTFTIPAGCTAEILYIGGTAWHVADGTATLRGSAQPTPAQFDNDQSLATTEFVQRALGSKRAWLPVNTSASLGVSALGMLIGYTGGSTYTVTLPPTAGLVAGAAVSFYNNSAVDQIVAAAGSDTIAWGSVSFGGGVGGTFTIPAGCTAEILYIGGTAWHVADGTATLRGSAQPTPAQFDNDQSLATTAFVQRALGNLQAAATFTGNQTLTAADAGKMLVYGETVAATVTLPAISGVPAGCSFEFLNTGTANLTVQRAGSDQIDGGNSTVNSIIVPPGMSLRLVRGSGSSLWHAVTFPAASLDGAFGSLLSGNGWKKVGDLIIQWGQSAVSGSPTTFPITFPNACFRVYCQEKTAGTPTTASAKVWCSPGPSASGITLTAISLSGVVDASEVCDYFAIGW